jgi:hypothetical protein
LPSKKEKATDCAEDEIQILGTPLKVITSICSESVKMKSNTNDGKVQEVKIQRVVMGKILAIL